ncbi:MAG: hypothetical protein RIC29_15850 [Rhodospirillaceae bacterium]
MTERLTDKELHDKIQSSIKDFSGFTPSLETAIGALFIGKAMGWEVLYLIHSQATIRKYEKILGIRYKDQMDASTELSRKSYVWGWTKKFNAFWNVVRGQEKRVDRTRLEEKPVDESDIHEEGNKK